MANSQSTASESIDKKKKKRRSLFRFRFRKRQQKQPNGTNSERKESSSSSSSSPSSSSSSSPKLQQRTASRTSSNTSSTPYYHPSKSNRILKSAGKIRPCNDDDIWIEIVVTNCRRCRRRSRHEKKKSITKRGLRRFGSASKENHDREVKAKSLFYSLKLGVAVCDEPPTGASRVIPAHDEALQKALGSAAMCRGTATSSPSSSSSSKFSSGQTKGGGGGGAWVEIPVVQGKLNAKVLQTRSLYYSFQSRKAKWDDPPTKAKKIGSLKHYDGDAMNHSPRGDNYNHERDNNNNNNNNNYYSKHLDDDDDDDVNVTTPNKIRKNNVPLEEISVPQRFVSDPSVSDTNAAMKNQRYYDDDDDDDYNKTRNYYYYYNNNYDNVNVTTPNKIRKTNVPLKEIRVPHQFVSDPSVSDTSYVVDDMSNYLTSEEDYDEKEEEEVVVERFSVDFTTTTPLEMTIAIPTTTTRRTGKNQKTSFTIAPLLLFFISIPFFVVSMFFFIVFHNQRNAVSLSNHDNTAIYLTLPFNNVSQAKDIVFISSPSREETAHLVPQSYNYTDVNKNLCHAETHGIDLSSPCSPFKDDVIDSDIFSTMAVNESILQMDWLFFTLEPRPILDVNLQYLSLPTSLEQNESCPYECKEYTNKDSSSTRQFVHNSKKSKVARKGPNKKKESFIESVSFPTNGTIVDTNDDYNLANNKPVHRVWDTAYDEMNYLILGQGCVHDGLASPSSASSSLYDEHGYNNWWFVWQHKHALERGRATTVPSSNTSSMT